MDGVRQSLPGTIRRADGTRQVNYHGHPFYLFSTDTRAGTANREGANAFGAAWHVMNATGNKIYTD
jgi:predicted lipoprotein with Yx(FWY)xxD motif